MKCTEPELAEMVGQALAEVEAGLYSEHPKLDVLRDVIGAELAANDSTKAKVF